LVVKITSPPSIFMLAVQQERTGLADVLVKWLELENRFAPQNAQDRTRLPKKKRRR